MTFDDNIYGLMITTAGACGGSLLIRYPPVNKTSVIDETLFPYTLSGNGDTNQSYNTSYSETYSKSLSEYSNDVLAKLLFLVPGKSEFNLQIENINFIGFIKRIVNTSEKTTFEVDSINVTFAFAREMEPYSAILQKLAQQIATALVHEENRISFLSKQRQLLLDLGEYPQWENMKNLELPKFIKKIFDAVKSKSWVDVYLNKWIRISYSLMNITSSLDDKNTALDRTHLISNLKPYHTLILLRDKESILNLPIVHCSPSLATFFRFHNPAKNFISIASDAMITPIHLKKIASNLILWGYADVVYPLNDTNVYAVCPNIDFEALYASFNSLFYSELHLTFLDVLAEFSVPASLRDHREALSHYMKSNNAQVFIWLLQHKVIYQVHTYVYTHLDKEANELSLDETNAYSSVDLSHSVKSDDANEEAYTEGSNSEKAKWTNRNADFVFSSRSAPNDYDEGALFHRLSSLYFNGKHHLEEILFLERIHRSQLLSLIDKYRNNLLLAEHEDPNICKL